MDYEFDVECLVVAIHFEVESPCFVDFSIGGNGGVLVGFHADSDFICFEPSSGFHVAEFDEVVFVAFVGDFHSSVLVWGANFGAPVVCWLGFWL